MSIIEQLAKVQEFLDQAKLHNLTANCVLTAINLAKDNPNGELSDVLDQALETWNCHLTEADYWNGPYD